MIVIRSGRHPFEIAMLAMLLISGTSNSIAYDRTASNAIRSAMPEIVGRICYGGMALGALVALIGVLFVHGLNGPRVERAGLLMISGILILFAVILAMLGWRALFFSLFIAGFAAAVIWRFVQIGRELKSVRAALVLAPDVE